MSEAIAFIAGLVLGIISGLLPGLHSNTVISVVSSLGIDENALAVMIIALFPAHLVISFIPSIFFGIPEAGTVVAVMPGQRMVLQGKGILALKVVLASSALAALVSAALFVFSLEGFSIAYSIVKGHIRWILLAVAAALVLKSRNPKASLPIFLLAGMIGQFSLESKMQDPFLPMFSGMFAIAAILNYRVGAMPKQKELEVGTGIVKFSLVGVLFGFAADLIPGVGSPAQVAAFISIFMPMNTVGYLACISSISISEGVFSLATAASIGKSRMGATAWLADNISINENLVLLLSGFLLSVVLAVALAYLARKHIAGIAEMDFSDVNKVLVFYLIAITWIIDSWIGVAVLVLGSVLGWLCIRFEVERINLMGAVIVPTLLFFFSL